MKNVLYTYNKYVLDIDLNNIKLSNKKEYEKIMNFLEVVVEIPNSKWTLRMAEKNGEIPKSTLHRWIHNELPYISKHLYGEILKQFEYNIHNHRQNNIVINKLYVEWRKK